MSRRGQVSALALLVAGALASPAFAQQPTPPEHYTLDQNGVDLVSGTFVYSTTDVVIGDPSDGGITHGRVWVNNGWRDTLAGSIAVSGNIYVVSVGAESEVFIRNSSGVFTPQSNSGATLSQSGTALTFTTRNGAVASYSTVYNGSIQPYDADGAVLFEYRTPAGEILTYQWNGVTFCETYNPDGGCLFYRNGARLDSVSNNRGYMIDFLYESDDLPDGQDRRWFRRTGARGVNLTIDYCPGFGSDCAVTRTWPQVTYQLPPAFGDTILSVTDQSSRTTTYGYGTGLSVTLPDQTTPQVTTTTGAGGRTTRVVGPTGQWDYAYVDSATERTTTVDGPNGQETIVVSDLATGRATSVTDGLGRETTYEYNANRMLNLVTLPEGNAQRILYDVRGNVTRVEQKAKPGTALPDIVTTAVYPAQPCANPVTCNQPTSVTDARGTPPTSPMTRPTAGC